MIEEGAVDEAMSQLSELEAIGDAPPEVFWLKAQAFLQKDELPSARDALTQALGIDADYADAHYVLAQVLRSLKDEEAALHHELETLRCDALDESDMTDEEMQDELSFIEGEAERCLSELPEDLRARLENVPVLLVPRPDEELVRSGFDARAFGLFEGPEDGAVAPTRIVIFHANLASEFPEPELLAEQVHVTLLHEVGHFFGLDEDGVARLGLA